MREKLEIAGVKVTIDRSGARWVAGWTGSDGKRVLIARDTKEALLKAIPEAMKHRATVLGVRF
jgi:hypothetical protein